MCALAVGLLPPLANHARASDSAPTLITHIGSPQLGLYDRASPSSKVRDIAKSSVVLPLDIIETDEDESFYKVKIDGSAFWVKRTQVSVSRVVTTGCLAQSAAPINSGGVRGAIRACK